jgi:pyrimidine deaminase RibD-like protein
VVLNFAVSQGVHIVKPAKSRANPQPTLGCMTVDGAAATVRSGYTSDCGAGGTYGEGPAQARYASSRRSQTSLMEGKQGTACQSRLTGTWPATAMVAEWISSSTPGPTKVTPSR